MASVLFSTVGQALGGPIAGAVGAIAGQGADAFLFGGRRRGRQPVARFQTSSYGETFPRIYGRIRQPGVVIWASPIRQSTGGKNGNPDRRSKHVSLAVAISSRPVLSVGRIWADGAEFRDSGGRFATPTVMRLYRGGADQALDPAIAAEEGLAGSPAFRRLAYVVFEDLPIAAFGNRIPAFSFEVEADAGEGDAGDWLVDLAREAGVPAAAQPVPSVLEGFAAAGEDWRGSIRAVAELVAVRLDDQSDLARFHSHGGDYRVAGDDLVIEPGGGDGGNRHNVRADWVAGRVASRSITYLDVERDYLPSTQRADAGAGTVELQSAHLVAGTAGRMQAIARRLLGEANHAGETIEIRLSWRWLGLRPGDRLQLPGIAGRWMVTRLRIVPMTLVVECSRVDETLLPDAGEAEPGRLRSAPVSPVPSTALFVAELPHLPGRPAMPALSVVATGAPGWRGATVEWAPPGSSTPAFLGDASRLLGHGVTLAPLAEGPTGIWDEAGELLVETASADIELFSRTPREALLGLSPLLIGGELLGFRKAMREAERRWRLSGLLRGQHFTQPAAHGAGAPWVLADLAAILDAPLDPAWVGGEASFWATGPGDGPSPARRSLELVGLRAAPLAPCHVRASLDGSGGLRIGWRPRARELADWSGEQGPGAPAFRLSIRRADDAAIPPWTLVTGETEVVVAIGGLQAAIGSGNGRIEIAVEAVGAGPPAWRTTGWRPFVLDVAG